MVSTAHRIFLLRSKSVFSNLAFEEALYQTRDLGATNHMLLWRDSPCVVIGRHQNPWIECQVSRLRQTKPVCPVVRRNSGGGTVYHDLGNLNVSFMTGRQQYARENNLQWLADLIRSKWGLDIRVSKRSDLTLGEEEKKISGSSSKLASKNAYHHCTLLFKADLKSLSGVLHPSFNDFETNATKSVKSPVNNLGMEGTDIENSIINGYLEKHCIHNEEDTVISVPSGEESQWVDETAYFTALKMFQSWDWNFGRTPLFTVHANLSWSSSPTSYLRVSLTVDKGRITGTNACLVSSSVDGSLHPVDKDLIEIKKELADSLHGLHCDPSELTACADRFRTNHLQNQTAYESGGDDQHFISTNENIEWFTYLEDAILSKF